MDYQNLLMDDHNCLWLSIIRS